LKDSKNRTLRMIGDPATRYREDPVRIIRAVRFAAKLSGLGFSLESKTAAPLVKSQDLLADVPQSRLFDEMLKLLQTGHALASIDTLKQLGMARGIYPLLDVVVERAEQPFVNAALKDTDRRVGEGKPVAPSFLLACVLWSDVRDGWARRLEQHQHSHPALMDAIDDVFQARIGDVSGGGKLASDMREIWVMQPRFEKRVGSTPFGLVEQARFRAAFDFMRLRADVGEVEEVLADWWQEFSMANDGIRQDMVDLVREEQHKRQRAPRTHRAQPTGGLGATSGSANTEHFAAPAGLQPSSEPGDTDSGGPRKRRRRRRSTGGGNSGENSGGNADGGAVTGI
jgi:poly(A) polymerase